jgi:diacylglycerol kinase (ATP)
VAWSGLVETALHQRNMRIHLVAGLLVALLASSLGLGPGQQLALVLSLFLVLAAEVTNSALEALVDLLEADLHDRARAAKDAAAAAVLLLAVGSVAVLAIVLVDAWPEVARERWAALRQAAVGVPLAAVMSALLAPWPRPRALDVALGALGVGLLAVLASFTRSPVFTLLAILLFCVALAAAARRRTAR